MKALVGAFNQEKTLVGAFSVNVQPVVEPMDRFTALLRTKVWEMKDLTAAEHLADPVWRTKMSQFWVDCADTAEAIPAPVLDHCPLARMFGPLARTMRFMMCKKEVTQKMCAMAQAEKLQRK